MVVNIFFTQRMIGKLLDQGVALLLGQPDNGFDNPRADVKNFAPGVRVFHDQGMLGLGNVRLLDTQLAVALALGQKAGAGLAAYRAAGLLGFVVHRRIGSGNVFGNAVKRPEFA